MKRHCCIHSHSTSGRDTICANWQCKESNSVPKGVGWCSERQVQHKREGCSEAFMTCMLTDFAGHCWHYSLFKCEVDIRDVDQNTDWRYQSSGWPSGRRGSSGSSRVSYDRSRRMRQVLVDHTTVQCNDDMLCRSVYYTSWYKNRRRFVLDILILPHSDFSPHPKYEFMSNNTSTIDKP